MYWIIGTPILGCFLHLIMLWILMDSLARLVLINKWLPNHVDEHGVIKEKN